MEYAMSVRNPKSPALWSKATALFLLSALQVFASYPNNAVDEEDELMSPAANQSSTGVTSWAVSEPYINLWLFDQPITYETSFGQPIGFSLAFKQRNHRSNS